MPIIRPDWFDFIFNGGRGIRKNQVDWSVSDSEFDSAVESVAPDELPAPTESQAKEATGATAYAWSIDRLKNWLSAQLPTVTDTEARAGTGADIRAWSPVRIWTAVDARITGARAKNLLSALTGNDRLDASAVKGIPASASPEDIVPFAAMFTTKVDRTFAEGLTNVNGEAIVSTGNPVPDGAPAGVTDFVVIDKNNSDGVSEDATLSTVRVGQWMRAEVGSKFIITRIAHINEDAPNDAYEMGFNPSTDIAETYQYDQLGTGAGEIRFYQPLTVESLSDDFLLVDGSNVTLAAQKAFQGNNETHTVRVKRVLGTPANPGEIGMDGVTNGYGQVLYYPNATDTDGVEFNADVLREYETGDFVDAGALEWRIGANPWNTFSGDVVQASMQLAKGYTYQASDVPAVNAYFDMVLEGRDIHSRNVVPQILKRSTPNLDGKGATAGQVWTAVENDGVLTAAWRDAS